MASDDLIQWITSGMKKGVKTEDLKKSLKDAGYTDDKIAGAFAKVSIEAPAKDGGTSKLPLVLVGIVIIALAAAFVLNSGLLSSKETPEEGPASNLFMEGKARFDAGDYDSAEQSFRDAIEAEPSSAEAYYYLGLIHESRGELTEAGGMFTKAAALDTTNPWYSLYLGFVLLQEDKNPEAGQAFLDAKERDPANAYSYFGLAVISLKGGDTARAQEYFDDGKELSTALRLNSALETWPELESLISR